MKKLILLLAVCVCALTCTGCSDEWGSKSVSITYYLYIGEESAELGPVKAVYDVNADGTLVKYPLIALTSRPGFLGSGRGQPETRRDFTYSVKLEIQYESGKNVRVFASIYVPYLEEDGIYAIPVKFTSEDGSIVYEGKISYIFSRSI
ncbi:hypothetical protein [Treponema brennaborense]|uniref:Lipoprotein n=1 Tax=Treponema brennaborense (strain DSM 12168 / CIP 105900 / DD5/3) TaxID=906968 RepID=F4LJP2_TREBD|nr:hypothetical protein [Treponema brennaborense]AEE17422.1 hypothetical protein Trebr_2007 [Treponema brennaborense DSM 12168]